MARFLRQSTAVTIKFGPFLDSGDGNTVEGSLTLSQADFRLSKNGGDFAQKNESSAATHDELGYYDVSIDATDTNTPGRLRVAVHESGALPVWEDFMIMPANVWDSLFGSDKLQVHADEITAELITSAAFAANAITNAAVADDVVVGSVAGAVGSVTAGVTLANNAVNAAAVAADAVAELINAVFANDLESGKTFAQAILDLWATNVGDATANDADDPTSATFDSPDGTVQVTHTLTGTTRTKV